MSNSGALQVGVLNWTETDFIATATCEVGPAQTVELVVHGSERMGRLVVRNAFAHGSSHGWFRLLKTTIENEPELRFEELKNHEEASSLAAQIRASAESLARIGSAEFGPPEVVTEVGKAAEQLRGFLGRGNLALIRANPDAIGEVFAGLEIATLHQIADHLKILLPLCPMPGWHFDEFVSRADFATLVRHALWWTLHRLRSPPTVNLPWHGGTTFATHFDNDLSMALFVGGTYEPNEFAFLDGIVRPGMTVVDGGANEGIYSLFLASKVGATGRVVAVEPSPRELTRLRANLAANNLQKVSVVAAALAERSGEVVLKIAEAGHAGQNTLGEFIYEGISSSGTETLSSVTLDELASMRELANIDVIKLDVEGAELRALTGATGVLRTARPLIILELSPAALSHQKGSVRDLTALLAQAEYRLLYFNPATGLLSPVVQEPFSNNLVAVHRNRDWDLPTA